MDDLQDQFGREIEENKKVKKRYALVIFIALALWFWVVLSVVFHL
jgi:predicted nucleic acid-binding Zn ribbon protein